MADRYFTPATFRFLKELKENNNRPWFQENKGRYEKDLKEPALRFIEDFDEKLRKISPHFHAGRRSFFRIYRDTRFSKDKSPYKTHAGLHFRHAAGKSAYTPGFYLHLEPRSSFAGVGLWRPDSATLKMIRDAVANEPRAWKKAVGGTKFTDVFSVTGDSLKRSPRGYDAGHELIEVLKLKDFTALAPLTQQQVTSAGFIDVFADLCRAGGPMVRFICEALDQPY